MLVAAIYQIILTIRIQSLGLREDCRRRSDLVKQEHPKLKEICYEKLLLSECGDCSDG